MRVLPRSRGLRITVIVVAALAVLVLLFGVIFPWIDRTFVNRPAIETPQSLGAVAAALLRALA